MSFTGSQDGAATEGSVGIVWGVYDGDELPLLIIDRTRLSESEIYGDFLTHPRGHYEVWEAWRRLGPKGLARCGLPKLVFWHEYEHLPRGCVVFDTRARKFTLYADTKLQRPDVLKQVLRAFDLTPTECTVRSDPHYRTLHL